MEICNSLSKNYIGHVAFVPTKDQLVGDQISMPVPSVYIFQKIPDVVLHQVPVLQVNAS